MGWGLRFWLCGVIALCAIVRDYFTANCSQETTTNMYVRGAAIMQYESTMYRYTQLSKQCWIGTSKLERGEAV